MPSILSSCNIAYTFLDESCFFAAGLGKADIYMPYITEDKGKLVTVFPVLRHIDIEKNTGAVLGKLLSGQADRNRVISVFPSCFNNGDTDLVTETSAFEFLSELSAYENKIDFSLPSRLIKSLLYLRKIYFPQKAVKQLLIKYPETNHLYAKMIFVHALIDQIRGDKIRKRRAYEELWKAQDYDLYCEKRQSAANQAAIRNAAYQALIEAENITRDYNGFSPSLMAFDFDFDGVNEYVFQGTYLNCFISGIGASIFELDYLPHPWNYGDIASANGKRYSFRDMIAPPNFSPSDIVNKNYSGVRLCGDECYDLTAMDRQRCRASFTLPPGGASFSNIGIEKTFHLNKNGLEVTYRIVNNGGAASDFIFIPELNMTFPNDSESGLRIYSYGEYESFSKHSEKQSVKAVDGEAAITVSDAAAIDFQDIDNEVIINLRAKTMFGAWIFSETGAAGLAPPSAGCRQSSRILIHKALNLEAGAAYSINFCLSFHHHSSSL
jgi:alpha-amylase